MAEKVESFDFRIRSESRRYDWDSWLDGSVWKLTPGRDFEIEVRNFQAMCYAAAARRSLKVHIAIRKAGVYIQAYKPADPFAGLA